jgi:uncharacterized Fe-S center protein
MQPFVTDTTTMPYHPWISRTLAMDHLETANMNGFNQGTMGCPVIIADGWLGTDDVIVDLQGRGNYLKNNSCPGPSPMRTRSCPWPISRDIPRAVMAAP